MAECNRGEGPIMKEPTKKVGSVRVRHGMGELANDHERAFFDSADWALWKRTPHQQLPPRRPACTSGQDGRAE
ncbi:hypothetical protein RJ641_021025 [Dillenia turbinata]|uniref:Uncharacterized protein n=1 Tax=Dillenia turbinata TaxID=194707 RepID=A0AAN8UGP6_9MAGN